ncbi:hydrolase [Leuconostoc koreense]|nr:hydrolase [Leuconostoc mesenteroides]QGM24559.1 hydrolase [Leuconostoc mesenteroides subsp. mesenteroides]
MIMKLKQADLLFVKNRNSEMDKGIVESTGNFVHVAILVNEENIIHATADGGVCLQSLQYFLEKNKSADVYRTNVINTKQIIINAKKHLGKPYNFSFRPGMDSFYCSQLVVTAFEGFVKFSEQPMFFGNKRQQISDFWAAYYKKLNESVPVNVPGTNPNDMSHDPQLHYIGKID